MSSLISGYNYDIFISYRQKDNKYDSWVTEFVDNLKKELEATFKEDISVYFDINPNDGLLETHDVDASLQDKLKCLIFIPIISRTYCDPKSFAWEHEFIAFTRQATNDQFGLKVKLPNGNIASRVLPIRIYDLDASDIKICESVLGGVLRSIDFIYKSSGVNRPLRASEDHPQDNLNKTYYRDQINKVANSIREIINALGELEEVELKDEEIHKEAFKPLSVSPKSNKPKIILRSVIIVVTLIISSIFFVPKLCKFSEKPEKSIAVLPFVNDSPDQENTYFVNGLMDEILNNLQKIKEFRVLSRTSTEHFRGTDIPTIPEIARKLNVNYIVEGSGQKYGNKYRLRVQLIAAKNEKHIWGESYEKEIKEISDIFQIQSQVAQTIASELKATITPEEQHLLEKKPTKSLEAYNLYLLGKFFINQNREESLREGIKCFNNAIQLDTAFALAYVNLSQCYQYMVRYSMMPREEGFPEAKRAVTKAIELDESLGEAHSTLGLIMIVFDWNIYGPEQEFQKAIKSSPNNSEVYSSYSQYLRWIGRYDQGIIFAKKALELDPLTPLTNMWLALNYLYGGQFDESINQLKKVLALDSTYLYAYSHLSYCYALKGLYPVATKYANKTLSSIENISNDPLDASLAAWVLAKSGETGKAKEILTQVEELYGKKYVDPIHIALIYAGLGDHDKTMEYLTKACEIRSGQAIYLNAFSNTFFKDISSDPRFKDLLRKIGFIVN
jgi:TolB-like protein